MYILCEGRLYVNMSDNSFVGVDVYPDKIIINENIVFDNSSKDFMYLTQDEVYKKFNILSGNNYIFPIEEKEQNSPEVKNDSEPNTTKKSNRGRPSTRG